MNIIRQVGAFYELFQRSHNQRKRCPQFVREIGEETIAFLIIFFVNFRFHLFEPDVVLHVEKLAQWQKNGRDDLYISVNISTKDFCYMDVYKTITSLVEKYQIVPSTLKLEITETAIMTGTAGELEIIGQFRKYGFEVEIDDFGSGYSSFNTLKDIDVDVLKIDMGFLRTTKPEHLERSMTILNMIISLSKMLGLSVITEGVETEEQVVKLSQMGCGIYQGYYFSKPIPVSEFEERYM